MSLRQIETARLLISRLERLSADSLYAHRASGLRGSLLRYVDQTESGQQIVATGDFSQPHIDRMLTLGFQILEKAAKEIRPPRRWGNP
ncbi:MAG: hypothetical protein R6V73_14375 [Anaerolineales bacterium]|jgi:hypothetical protein